VTERYRVGILGSGRIAQSYDSPQDARILTASHAIQRSSRLAIGGYYDWDPKQAEGAEARWSVPPSSRDRRAWLESKWDVIYIATPDANHVEDLRDAIAQSPRAIWVEKPLALESSEGDAVLALAAERQVPVVVNYPRRWNHGLEGITRMIAGGAIGTPLSGVFSFSGGAGHNGVHLLDLFAQLWGSDWYVESVSPAGAMTQLRFTRAGSSVDAVFLNVPAEHYYAFEMRVYGSEGKLEIAGSPETLQLSTLRPDLLFPSVRVFTPVTQLDIDAEPMLLHAAEAIGRLIDDPIAARAHAALERSRQRFIGDTLRFLQQP